MSARPRPKQHSEEPRLSEWQIYRSWTRLSDVLKANRKKTLKAPRQRLLHYSTLPHPMLRNSPNRLVRHLTLHWLTLRHPFRSRRPSLCQLALRQIPPRQRSLHRPTRRHPVLRRSPPPLHRRAFRQTPLRCSPRLWSTRACALYKPMKPAPTPSSRQGKPALLQRSKRRQRPTCRTTTASTNWSCRHWAM
ncbi:hypothetical protein BIW11_12610 [Tropilaelaps mercedesae]|uniref:Uncharacterized protein n=1 Tax=Tropilaelaps mercedesae TaxID=418985 RepID=A0A1V9X664_9ACAR|nr:hypothetical protein BIW11_12610 [Tropilaelaps mercedesae]